MTRSARIQSPPEFASARPCIGTPGLLRRLAALFYDSMLLVGVLFAATGAALPFRGGEAFRPGDPRFLTYLLGVSLVFYGWFWTHGGQTLGMRAWQIRIVAADGGPVNWRQATVRCAFALLSAACGGLGYLWTLRDPHKRSWHDLASGTRLVGYGKSGTGHSDGHRPPEQARGRGAAQETPRLGKTGLRRRRRKPHGS